MKVAFITEYFPPFTVGGGEWSTYYLARNLKKIGVEVVIITPDLGSRKFDNPKDVNIRKIPFYLKPKSFKTLPGNFAYSNPLWIIWAAFFYYQTLKKENVDIIHVQGKYSIPPVIFANLLLQKPLVATIRDYIAICNYGICLMSGEKACNLIEYFLDDFMKYYAIYVKNKNPKSFILNLMYAIWGRLTKNMLKISLNRINSITTMSIKQKEILEKNNIRKSITVIRNSFEFEKSPKKVSKHQNIALFVGRLTYGKGVNLILESIPKVQKVYPKLKFLFVGSGPLENEITRTGRINKKVIFIGRIAHQELSKIYKKSALVLVPSIWPEPFARVVVESLSNITPVVVTRSGGLPEVIEDGRWGYVSEKNVDDLAASIIKTIDNNSKLRANIASDFKKICEEFSSSVALKHLKLYKQISE